MAIFASTTTSGYSDPLKAQSIKALEQRLKDQQAQMAAQPGITPENTQTPIQGFGHVANALADSFQQRRSENAVAAQRDMLAKSMAGLDYGNPDPQRMAQIAVAAPDIYKDVAAAIEARRAQQAQFTQADKTQTALFGHQDKTAAEAARVAREAKIDEEQRLANRPASDAARIMQDVESGKLPPEQGKALIDKLSAPSAAEQKAGNELQNTHLDTQGAISDLKEARALLGPKGEGIRSGSGASWAQPVAKVIGDRLGLTDSTLTQPTERYNQLMSAEAITAMAAKLKGATTDFELKAFVALMNNPDADPKTKMQALDKMIAKAEAHAALQLDQMKRAKVSVPGGGASAAPPQPSSQDAEALAWATANPDDPRAAAIKQRLGK